MDEWGLKDSRPAWSGVPVPLSPPESGRPRSLPPPASGALAAPPACRFAPALPPPAARAGGRQKGSRALRADDPGGDDVPATGRADSVLAPARAELCRPAARVP